jgi:hypothetical protein
MSLCKMQPAASRAICCEPARRGRGTPVIMSVVPAGDLTDLSRRWAPVREPSGKVSFRYFRGGEILPAPATGRSDPGQKKEGQKGEDAATLCLLCVIVCDGV